MKKDILIKSALSPQKLVGSALGAAKKFRALEPGKKLSHSGTKLLGQVRTFSAGAIKNVKDKFTK